MALTRDREGLAPGASAGVLGFSLAPVAVSADAGVLERPAVDEDSVVGVEGDGV